MGIRLYNRFIGNGAVRSPADATQARGAEEGPEKERHALARGEVQVLQGLLEVAAEGEVVGHVARAQVLIVKALRQDSHRPPRLTGLRLLQLGVTRLGVGEVAQLEAQGEGGGE